MTRERKSGHSRRSPSKSSLKSQDRHRSSKQTKHSRSRSPRNDDSAKSKTKRRRSRSKSAHKSSKKTKLKSPPDPKDVIVIVDEPLDKEAEQERLEREMQKRRERIEQWRAARKQQQPGLDVIVTDGNEGGKWTLEDDDDEEEGDAAATTKQQLLDLDPLDAYMLNVNEEVKKIKEKDKKFNTNSTIKPEENPSSNMNIEKFRIVTVVAKKANNPIDTKKPELMESNADAIEYSSEEEVEGLDDQMDKLNKKKKELMAVDHSKIYYHPFRKNFYVEVPEVSKMTPEEVEALRIELDSIAVRGKGCPNPITSWAQCGVSKKLLEALKKNNFEKPTAIQAQALPIIMSGRDLIGIAKTGSGKTLAFILPMLRHILDQPHIQQEDGPIAIILTPTRELAMQIGAECRKVGRTLGIRVACVYGGAGISEQIGELKRGVEVVVCTPGRMIDMLAANNGRVTNLRRCTYLVLDEADRMFDMGFEPQVMKIVENVRPDRQTVMFSATFPRQMESLARRILTKPLEITVGGRSIVPHDVQQFIIILEDHHKFLKLLELLGIYQEQGSVLVFVHKQEHADELMKNLLKHAYPCLALHGGIDQYDRDSSIDDFKQGNVKLLIATSVCSRGLDVKDLNLVVNYDCPNHYEDYVHRCGRTGRAGNKGVAYTFVSPSQGRYCGDLINALTLSKQPVPPELQQLWDSYKIQAEADGVKLGGFSGFKGKGFKFDADEAQLADDRKKLQKQALGIHDSDDEDAGLNIDQKIEKLFASKKKVSEVTTGSGAGTVGNAVPPPAANQEKLELAKKVASIIHLNKHIGPEASDINLQTAAAIFKGAPIAQQSYNSKTVAEQMAESINARLGYQPAQIEERPPVTTDLPDQPTTKKFEEELDINDFPQTARFKVTSREALRSIGEYSDAGLTVRGAYFAPNKEPREGERKLYLAIEADNELAIQKAKAEVARIIKEELVRLQNSYQPLNRSRYTVV